MTLVNLIRRALELQKNDQLNSADLNEKWERSWEHAKNSHTHVQSVIQFIDTKTSMLVGISAIVTAGVASAPFWIISLSNEAHLRLFTAFTKHPWLTDLLVTLWAMGLASGAYSLISALLSTIARQPNHIEPLPSPEIEMQGLPKKVILFPLSTKFDLVETTILLRSLRGGLSHSQVLMEYEKQLLVTGAILQNKIEFNRRAVTWLIVHIVVAFLMVAVFAIASIP